jgi:hypothetical protein
MHGKFGLNFNNSVGIGNAKGINFGSQILLYSNNRKPVESIDQNLEKTNDSLTKSRKKSL